MTSVRQAQEAPPEVVTAPPEGGALIALAPRLSVIVPATDEPPTLERVTAAITPGLGPRDELIVIREPKDAGPAEARNLGAQRAHGDILVFVDADVELHPEALARIRRRLADDLDLMAVFGTYDDRPAAEGVVSNFRNLLHHHVHSSSAGPAKTFWTGLGAIRRHTFQELGGFGFARYPRASVEDIELGLRLTRADMRVELDPEIRGCHLKHWSFRLMVYTDFARRGVPWVRLLIERRDVPSVLNLGWRHRITSGLTLLLGGSLLSRRLREAAAALAAIVVINRSFYALLARRRGVGEATIGVGLHLVHHLIALASIPAGAAVHLRRSLMRGGDPRVARRAPSKPVSHERNVSARRFRRDADRELRVGLVGCGRLAERGYVPAARLADGVTLAAVADPVAARCAAAAPGVPAFASVEDLIDARLVDALVVATPASTHLSIAQAAQAAGLAVLVEKPPADDTASARALAELEPAPWLGFNRRFEPAVAALARLVPLGEPLEFDLSFSGQRGEWGAHDVRDDVLLDLGPHLIDVARVLSGAEIERVSARLTGESASLELDLGVRGRALIALAGDRQWEERFTVRDSTGRTLGTRSATGLRARAVRLARTSGQHPLVYSLARQLEAFSAATRGASAPLLAGPADGVAVMTAIDAARASAAADGAWVDVAATPRDARVIPA